MPIGPTTIARVKPNSLYITCLVVVSTRAVQIQTHVTRLITVTREDTHAGTAGAILLFSPATGLKSFLSSFLSSAFSSDTFLRVVMMLAVNECWCLGCLLIEADLLDSIR